MLCTQETQEMSESFWQKKNLKEIDHLEDLGIDGRIS
jgi:hypothetical protein